MQKQRKFTLVYTYYNEPHFLEMQIERWKEYTAPIDIFLFDDGSQIKPAYDLVKDLDLPDNITFSFYLVTKDLGFNSHGCRNLAAEECKTSWLIFLDIDTLLSKKDLDRLQDQSFSPDTRYDLFGAQKKSKKVSQLNKFIMSKIMFLDSDGYDEKYTGWHTGDREFYERLEKIYKAEDLTWTNLEVVRGGRKARKDNNLKIPIYDDEKMIIWNRSMPKDLPNVPNINFPWKKMI